MSAPSIVQRHPALRWLAPIAVVGIAGLAATGVFKAGATSGKLPATSPAALIAAVQQPHVAGFSGTLVSRLSLGLPELPDFGASGDGVSMSSLLSGSHTLQVWYGGPAQQRIALLGATDETDVFRSGREFWQWSSADHTAVHTVLPAVAPQAPAASVSTAVSPAVSSPAASSPAESVTPSGLAASLLALLDPTTSVEVKDDQRVADRDAYELILTPRTPSTRVASAHIYVDGRSKVPLGVQVYARGQQAAAIDVAFSTIRFAQPSQTYFHFQPPAGATVHTVDLSSSGPDADPASRLRTTGTTWSTIFSYRLDHRFTAPRGPLGDALTPVSGSWGKGHLLESGLLCVLLTDDGRVYAGAVDPDALYAAAAAK